MSSKVEIVTVNTPLNSSSFQQQINHNFSVIEASLNKQLQREPQEDVNNEMEQELDMNSHRIINVAEPVNNSDAATKHYVDTTVKPELEANKVVVSDSNGDIVSSSITTTELNTLSGISGNIQEQLNGKQNTISDLAEIRAGAAAGATALQSADLKTINGESLVGEGDIVIRSNMPFNPSWTTNDTTAEFLADVNADVEAVPGMCYVGSLTCSDLPFNGNADAFVQILESSTSAPKVVHVTLTSGTNSPYHWELSYWVIGGTPHNSGWIGFQPELTAGNNITISGATISAPVMTGASSLVAGTSGAVPQPAIGDQVKFLRGDGTWVDLGTVMRYKGSVATYADLPSSGMEVGDVWNVLADGKNYAWTGTAWDDFGGVVTISIAACSDVSLSSLANEDVLVYNSSTQKWENGQVRQTYRGVYDAAVTYAKGDVVEYGSYFYIAKNTTTGNAPNDNTYWSEISNDGLVHYSEKSDNVEYPIGCTNNGISGTSYSGSMNFTTTSSPTINASTGALTATVLKTTTQTQGDNSTNAATTAYVDTAVGGVTASVSSLTDVQLTSLSNDDVLVYNSTAQKWKNKAVRQMYRGVYDITKSYLKGDVVSDEPLDPLNASYYIAVEDVAAGLTPVGSVYWKKISNDYLVRIEQKTNDVEYPLGCVPSGVGLVGFEKVYYSGTSTPTINASTGALTASVLKTTTKAQGDNSTNAATTAYVDTALDNLKLTDIAMEGSNVTFGYDIRNDYTILGSDVSVSALGIASGFSASSYIYKDGLWNSIINDNPAFEYVTKFNLSSLSDDSTLAYIAAGAWEPFVLFVYSNGKVAFRGQTTNMTVTMDSGSFYVGTGTDYWVKVSITQSSVVTLSTSTDGITYTDRSTFNINRPFESAAANFAVGCSYTRSGYVVTPKPCLGTIDLTETYFSDGNGNYLWKPIGLQSNKMSINASHAAVDQTYDGTSSNAQSGVAIAGAGFLTKVKETYTNPALTASGDVCTWTVTHTLNSRDVVATVYDTTTYKEVLAEVIHTDASTLTVNLTSSSDISAGAYQIVIIG